MAGLVFKIFRDIAIPFGWNLTLAFSIALFFGIVWLCGMDPLISILVPVALCVISGFFSALGFLPTAIALSQPTEEVKARVIVMNPPPSPAVSELRLAGTSNENQIQTSPYDLEQTVVDTRSAAILHNKISTDPDAKLTPMPGALRLLRATCSFDAKTPLSTNLCNRLVQRLAAGDQGSKGAQKDCSGALALHVAALSPSSGPLRTLIEARADVNSADADGVTALHVASVAGCVAAVQGLLQCGAAVNCKVRTDLSTPLHGAAMQGSLPVVDLLLLGKSDIQAQDASHATALHYAVAGGHFECTKALLCSKAACNAEDAKQRTPLHAAAEVSDVEIVRLLMANGANLHAKDMDGNTPLCTILRHQYAEVGVAALEGVEPAKHQRRWKFWERPQTPRPKTPRPRTPPVPRFPLSPSVGSWLYSSPQLLRKPAWVESPSGDSDE